MKRAFVGWTLLLLCYAGSRGYDLGRLPVYNDEAIFVRFTERTAQGDLFVTYPADPKDKPLLFWICALATPWFEDHLLLLRAFSALAGGITLIGIFFAARRYLASRQGPWIAAGLYLILPYALFYNRLGLYESLVAAFGVWLLFLGGACFTGARGSVGKIVGFGALLGLSLLTKSYAFFFLLLPPALILCHGGWGGVVPGFRYHLRGLCLCYAIAALFLVGGYLVPMGLQTGSFTGALGGGYYRQRLFDLSPLLGNLRDVAEIWRVLFTPSTLLLFAAYLVATLRGRARGGVLLLFVAGPTLLSILLGLSVMPRYLFVTVPFVVIAATIGLEALWRWWSESRLLRGLLLLLLLLPLGEDALLLFRFEAAPMPAQMRLHYIEGWPSGYGVRETLAFLDREGEKRDFDLFTTPILGIMHDPVASRFDRDPRIRVHLAPWYRKQPLLPPVPG
ncbi:MAG: hypothetical protein D6795_16620, partial [Deltaproteobacteria bacterium]